MAPRVFRKTACLWKMCISHPKNEAPLKASGTFSGEQPHSAIAGSGCTGRYFDQCFVWLRLEVRQVPPVCCPGGSLPSPAASLDSSCSQLFPQQGWGCSGSRSCSGLPPLLFCPSVLACHGNRLLLPLGPFFSACSAGTPAHLSGSAHLPVLSSQDRLVLV